MERKHWLAAGLVVFGLAALSLIQGLNWDEVWVMGRTRDLLAGAPLSSFKPLAGLTLLPVALLGGEYVAGRLLFLIFQAALGWGLFRLLPAAWPRALRVGAVLLLWGEPTFRERVLELRTDSLSMLLLLAGSLLWRRRPWLAALGIALGLALSPKLMLWLFPWCLLLPPVRERLYARGWLGLPGVAWVLAAGMGCGALLWGGVLWGGVPARLVNGLTFPFRDGLAFLAPTTAYYLKQALVLGSPYWLLAAYGLVLRFLRDGGAGEGEAFRHWELAGWIAFGLSLFYPVAFPYHLIGLALGVWPSAARGLAALVLRFPKRAAAGVSLALLLSGGVALWPVLAGPTLQDQRRVMAVVQRLMGSDGDYVDGVGWLPRPQAGPFVTAAGIEAGIALDLAARWDRSALVAVVLNGRSEQLIEDRSNLDWLNRHMVQVHPNLLVPGGRWRAGEAAGSWSWTLKVGGAVHWRALGDGWSLDGMPLAGQGWRALLAGEHQVAWSGGGRGELVLFRWMEPTAALELPPACVPFFLPFQRW